MGEKVEVRTVLIIYNSKTEVFFSMAKLSSQTAVLFDIVSPQSKGVLRPLPLQGVSDSYHLAVVEELHNRAGDLPEGVHKIGDIQQGLMYKPRTRTQQALEKAIHTAINILRKEKIIA